MGVRLECSFRVCGWGGRETEDKVSWVFALKTDEVAKSK